MKKFIILILFVLPVFVQAQNLPSEVKISTDGRLTFGGNITEGLYQTNTINKIEITLEEANWFQLMDGTGGPNGNPGELLIATLNFNDELILDSVLVGIKGQTSDFQNNSQKKSFKIELDAYKDQDLLGYDNLNLNCAFQDHSSMREVLYYDISRSFTSALKGAFVDLYINGEYWGPYNSIQQIEGTYIQEWFTNNEGTRWRALRIGGGGGPGGPGGPNFGAGTSTLNYNGADSTDYNTDYTLKKATKENPWEDLIQACDDLNNVPIEDLYDQLKYSLDIDRTLWYLAQEMVFADDDSYIFKGGMDYYVYWDEHTDRIIPMEVDGNSVLRDDHIQWSPFYNENNDNFPLLARMLQNTEIRQRYLAHLRTILSKHFLEEKVHERIDEFAAMLDQKIQDDPKKLYSYTQFLNGVQALKDLITTRIDVLASHPEINRLGLSISNVVLQSSAGIGIAPQANEEVTINAAIAEGAKSAFLYYGLGFDGVYERVEMFDDGMHGDQAADDNIYGAYIPGFLAGDYIRYYIEAIKNDEHLTASFFPEGAEHDVFIYQVAPAEFGEGDIVINEFMASNDNTVSDNANEFDDWIELYNAGEETIDLSGFYLSDDASDITQWSFPENTSLAPDQYLIIWADDDEDQMDENNLHANFRLSAAGESIYLLNAEGEIIDHVDFNKQEANIAFARRPNGIGDFEKSPATFNENNDTASSTKNVGEKPLFSLYPNPTNSQFYINSLALDASNFELSIFDITGQQVLQKQDLNTQQAINVMDLSNGMYIVRLKDTNTKQTYQQKLMLSK